MVFIRALMTIQVKNLSSNGLYNPSRDHSGQKSIDERSLKPISRQFRSMYPRRMVFITPLMTIQVKILSSNGLYNPSHDHSSQNSLVEWSL